MIEKRRVAEVRNRAAPAAAPAGPVDEEAESAPAAPDAPEVEHVVAPGRGRRVQDVTKVEARHRTAGERLAGCHGDPGTGERVEVRGQASGHRAVEEFGKVARECRLQAAQMWLEPRCGGSEEESPEGDAASASAAAPGRHASWSLVGDPGRRNDSRPASQADRGGGMGPQGLGPVEADGRPGREWLGGSRGV